MADIEAGAMLARLRAATRLAHDRLEAETGLMSRPFDRAAYRRQLERFHGFWQGWQPAVATLLRDEEFLRPRRRLHLLAADLLSLGLAPDAIAALPACRPPELGCAAAAMGSLYVMEGSTLGGRLILRHVERHLGLSGGGSYFTGYGDRTGAMWRSFLARLDQWPAAEAERIVCGAKATFEQLGWWFAQP